MRALALLLALALPALAGGLACTATPAAEREDYLRYVALELINESVVMRWPRRKMPLRVHLPRPPQQLFEKPEAIYDSVRDGVLDWTDVVEPGVPSFEFVDGAGDADIPFVWAKEPTGDWYIAFCAYDIDAFTRRFGVSHILVTARGANGQVADLHDVYATVLHEMGHALGLTGHSPYPDDVMSPRLARKAIEGPSPRDRATLRRLYELPRGHRVLGARQLR